MNETRFIALKRMLQVSKQILWVNDSCGSDTNKPASMVSGFSKSITHERPNWISTHIDFNMESRTYMSAGPIRIIGRINGTHPSENETDLLGQHGRSLQETWHYLAPFGRFIEIRKRNSNVFQNLPIEPFERNISFCSVDALRAVVRFAQDTLLLATRLARPLAIPVDTINTRKPPHSFGLYPPVAVELLH